MGGAYTGRHLFLIRQLAIGAIMNEDLIYRLRKRAEIRRQIPTRKSVQNNEPDRLADLLEEAADYIESLEERMEI